MGANEVELTPNRDIPKTPATPNATLSTPKRLPKAGAFSMATPRTMKPIDMKTNETVSNSLNMPWIPCHKKTSVAWSPGVAPEA